MTMPDITQASLLKAVVVVNRHEHLDETRQVLLATEQIDLCSETTSYILAFSQIERNQPDLVFCSVGEQPGEALALIDKLKSRIPSVQIVCIGYTDDSELILRCFRTGADEFLVAPLQHNTLVEMLQRLRQRKNAALSQSLASQKQGKVIALWGSRGGSGVTTLACNLASTLAESKETVLMDLHDTQGDLGLFFDQQPNYSIQDIWGRGERIDESLVESISVEDECGLRLLLQPGDYQPPQWVASEFDRLMSVLLAKYEFIILDLGHDEETLQRVFPFIDEIFLVVNQTVPSIFLTTRKLRCLEYTGFDLTHLRIVLNNYSPHSVISRKHIESTVGIPAWQTIRRDEKTVLSAINQGIPLHRASKWSKARKDIVEIARRLLDEFQPTQEKACAKGHRLLRPLISNNGCPKTAPSVVS